MSVIYLFAFFCVKLRTIDHIGHVLSQSTLSLGKWFVRPCLHFIWPEISWSFVMSTHILCVCVSLQFEEKITVYTFESTRFFMSFQQFQHFSTFNLNVDHTILLYWDIVYTAQCLIHTIHLQMREILFRDWFVFHFHFHFICHTAMYIPIEHAAFYNIKEEEKNTMKFDGMENVERFWKKFKNRFFF